MKSLTICHLHLTHVERLTCMRLFFHTTQYALDAHRPRMCRFVLTRCHDHALRVQFVYINDFCNGADRLDLNACIKGHLEPTHLKSSPLFTFSTKS